MPARQPNLLRYGLLLFAGFLALFALRHAPTPQKVPGLLALNPAGYLALASRLNPVLLINQWLGVAPMWLYRAELLLVLAFLFAVAWRAIEAARRRPPRPADAWVIGAVVLLCSLPLLLLPYIFSRDVYSYIVYGRIAAIHGANPELTPPSAYPGDPFFQYLVSWRDTPSVYGPAWTLVSQAITLLAEAASGALWQYMLGYKLLMLGLHLANAWLIWRLLGEWKPAQQTWGTLLYAWNPVALIEFVGSAHNDILMLSFVLLSVLLAWRGRWRWALVALVCAGMVKWIALALLPLYGFMLLCRAPTWPARLRLAGEAAALVAATVLLLHLPYGQVAQAIAAPISTQTAMRAENTIGALAIAAGRHAAGRLGLGSAHDPALRQALEAGLGTISKLLFGLGWLVALFAIARRPTLERYVASSCWLLVFLLLVAPVFRVWYVTWPLALAALLSWRHAARLVFVFSATAPLVYLHWGASGWSDALVYAPVVALLAAQLWRARATAWRWRPLEWRARAWRAE